MCEAISMIWDIFESRDLSFVLPVVNRATISERALDRAPHSADTLPPPGTGSPEATFSRNDFIGKSTSMAFHFPL